MILQTWSGSHYWPQYPLQCRCRAALNVVVPTCHHSLLYHMADPGSKDSLNLVGEEGEATPSLLPVDHVQWNTLCCIWNFSWPITKKSNITFLHNYIHTYISQQLIILNLLSLYILFITFTSIHSIWNVFYYYQLLVTGIVLAQPLNFHRINT